ncbi:MAG: hypothetical protein GX640_18160 [Fibrobacter sp.]|nr:hypothetical protein [Fibrobacter sp.]
MDLPAILIKITGFVLLMWNSFSVYKHIQEKRTNKGDAKKVQEQSLSEQALNTTLLYLWLTFMFVFSIGMIVNN